MTSSTSAATATVDFLDDDCRAGGPTTSSTSAATATAAFLDVDDRDGGGSDDVPRHHRAAGLAEEGVPSWT